MLNLRRRAFAGLRFALLTAAVAVIASAQTAPVSYTVTLDPKPTSHFVHIELSVANVTGPSVEVAMPVCSTQGQSTRFLAL